MSIPEELQGMVPDVELNALLTRLYLDALRNDAARRAESSARGIADEDDPNFYQAMAEAYMPVVPAFGKLLYTLVRVSRARTVLEFGTSFGISTIFLAAALRANGSGRVITIERDARKVERAGQHLHSAGLSDFVEHVCGDARAVLGARSWGPIELLFLDGPKAMYLDVLKRVEPELRDGALVVSDNSEMDSARAYLEYLRAPDSGYTRVSLVTEALGSQYRHELALRSGGRDLADRAASAAP